MSSLPRLSTDRDKTRRKSCHRSNNSDELESLGRHNGSTLMHQLEMLTIRDGCNTRNRQQEWREGRVSLDIPSMKYTTNHHYHRHHYHRQHSVSQPPDTTSSEAKGDVKKHRQQPSSPGGKLASFFNSLISQALSKKKKLPKSSSSSQHIQSSLANNKENIPSEQESPSNWRKLRNSGNFTTSTKSRTTISSINSSSCSPPYPIKTPTKLSYKNFFSRSRCKNIVIPSTKPDPMTQVSADLDWLDEKLKCIKHQSRSLHKERSLTGRNSSAETTMIKRFKEEEDGDEDGGESDSSSDLFELQLNYDRCSSGLPVYETTCVNTINRPIV